MDLSFSPDFEAFYCYAIVFLVGAFVAVSQLRQRIGQIEGIWFIRRTWWLFAIYTAVPVVLFWFLDRTGAINDTSFFAALLVGFGYERIITGGSQMVRAPGDVSQFWTPFIAYADRIAALVRDQDASRRRRLADQVVSEIDEDQTRIAALEELARRYAPDIAALNVQLAEIDASAAARGPASALEDKVRALYNVILTVPDGHDSLVHRAIISKRLYWLHVRRLASAARMVCVAVACVGILIAGIWKFEPDTTALTVDYYLWRIGKANSTGQDQFRARKNLAPLLGTADADLKAKATTLLAYLIQQPALPMERVDLALLVLLENRGSMVGRLAIPNLLVQALRSPSVDARARIHEALKFLVEYCQAEANAELAGWSPGNGDSTATLERKIRRWQDYWAKDCAPRDPAMPAAGRN